VAENQDVLQRAQTRASESIGRMAGQGRQQIAEAAGTYRKENAPTVAPSQSFVHGAIRTGNTTDLAKLNDVLSGAGPNIEALDVAPEAANELGAVLTGGGSRYLTKQMGGFGLLENLMGRQGGGLVQQQAESAGRELGTEAEKTEKQTTEDVRTAAEAGRTGAQSSLRTILENLRGDVSKQTPGTTISERAKLYKVGMEEKAALKKQAMDQLTPELDRLYGTTGAGLKARQAAMPQIKAMIREAVKKSATAPTIGKVITQNQADQLGRIASLIGGTAPAATGPGNYSGQYQMDPNIVQNVIARLFPKTPKGPDLPTGASQIPHPGQLILPGGEDYEPNLNKIEQVGQFSPDYNPLADIM
jgi:hypothetical protein